MSTVIIGSGPNGLAAAFYLAKAGFTPLVLEQSGRIGGGAITGELAAGFRCPTLTHEILVHEDVVRDMRLREHGLELLTPDVEVCAPSLDGPPVVLFADPERSAAALRPVHPRDAEAWPAYQHSLARAASVLAPVLTAPPPDIDHPSPRDLWDLLRAGRRFRALGTRESYRLLRRLPMPAADLVREAFESETLRAALAGPAVSGTMLGPRSAGSGLVLLLRHVHTHLAGGRPLRVRGGPGALTEAMAAAARAAGADIRTATRATRILTRQRRVAAVLTTDREIPADLVLSTADPRTTCLGLLDPADLGPDVSAKLRNYRSAGTLAKINLALGALPAFRGVEPSMLAGRVHIGPTLDDLERSFDPVKYGEMAREPWLDVAVPSLLDPQLAPAGAHVMSVYAHGAPYRLKHGEWSTARDTLLTRVMGMLERFAPGIGTLVVASQVITPEDLEEDYGFSGGHIFHGEIAPDQLFTMRPLIGYGRYAMPIEGLYLGGGGAHPGGFLTGASGRLAAAEIIRRRVGGNGARRR
jgi:phytoene dehydrogenase-like protein